MHMSGKTWFLDRMALLYDDVAAGSPDTDFPFVISHP